MIEIHISDSVTSTQKATISSLTEANVATSSKTTATSTLPATTTGILQDLHLRNQAANLRYYPWALLAISGLALAIYQIKKA